MPSCLSLFLALLVWLPSPATMAQGRNFAEKKTTTPSSASAGAPEQRGGTRMLRGATKTWRTDTARETRKEQVHWSAFREKEYRRFMVVYRLQTERALQAARARAEAFEPFISQNSVRRNVEPIDGDNRSPSTTGTEAQPGNGSQQRAAQSPEGALPPSPSASRVGETVAKTTDGLARTIENTINGKTAHSGPGSWAVTVALLILFLTPAAIVVLLAMAVLSLRGGHRLQASVLAGIALGAGALLFSALNPASQGSPESSPKQLHAEIKSQASTIAASVEYPSEEGVVLSSISVKKGKVPATDNQGWALLVTDKSDKMHSGSPVKLEIFPIGATRIPNAAGAMAWVPTYTDSMETALDYHWRARQQQNEWWWQRLSHLLAGS